MFHRIVLVSIVLLGLAPLPAVVEAASLRFEQVNISGASMNLPRGW